MGVLIQILANYAPYIYLVCGLVALYQLYRLLQVRADRRQAVFSLERERAIRNLYGIFTVALMLVLVMGATYFASSTLPRAAAAEPTPADELPPQFSLQIVPTNTPLPATPSATPTGTLTPPAPPPTTTVTTTGVTAATVDPAVAALTPAAPPAVQTEETPATQPTATATATPEPAPPPAVAAAPVCDERSSIASPGNGATVSGVFTLVGTATHDAFNFYKVEFAPGENASGGFTYLADGRGPVFGGALASVDTRGFGNGPWTFQLTVVDQTGNYPDPCKVTVIVQN
jgi:hypothetical protein